MAEGVALLAAVTVGSAAVVWLRRHRLLGFSVATLMDIWGRDRAKPPAGTPPEEWLDEQRARREALPHTTALERARGVQPAWALESAAVVKDEVIFSTYDSAPIGVRVVMPRRMPTDNTSPMCVFLHGGGWVFGGRGTHDHIARRFAYSGIVTVLIEYRRSPEHRFPVPLLDCMDGIQWASRTAPGLGCDPTQLVVAGDSAGANLAFAACLKGRDNDWAGYEHDSGPVAGMLLVYPCLSRQLVTEPGGSYERFAEGYGLSRDDMAWYWEQYGGCPVGDPVDPEEEPYLAPLDVRANFSLMPPAKILLADHDVLRDDGEQMAGRLRAAGVHVSVDSVRYTVHGLYHNRRLDPGAWEAFMEKSVEFIRRATQGE